MLFNSVDYLIFLPIVFALYWLVPGRNIKFQNIILLVASYIFYGFWDYRFLFLLAFSTFLDYFTGIRIHEASNARRRKIWLLISVITNLGFLGFFKYYNFFISSFGDLLQSVGFQANYWTLQIILPVGISFYTFHGLSYVFDIYNRKITPCRNVVDYTLFVSFFPLLVAGPIERATHLLPQIQKQRTFQLDHATDGMRQILWGLFKKIVIADNCAVFANQIFDHPENYSGSTLVLGAFLFAIQIYGDFSGYSDIALGTARLFGFELLRNFAFPYFSRDIAEFWRRWHISLSSWFRDYLYIPLGGSKGGRWMSARNTFIIFLVSGLWHGANWTFIFWGALNALYFMPLLLFGRNRVNLEIVARGRQLPKLTDVLQIAATFGLTTFAWIFFRAESMTDAFVYISGILSPSLWSAPEIFPATVLALVAVFLIVEWLGREHQHALANINQSMSARPVRWVMYYIIAALVFVYFGQENEFIYFQF